MKSNFEQPWIEAGYQIFSKEGPSGLKVDHLARKVGISRSSFYNLFADLDLFQEILLVYHARRAKQAAERVRTCRVIDPDFLKLIIEEKDYILFNRQLRIHRHIPAYEAGFENAIMIIYKEARGIWEEMLGLQHKPSLALNTFKITADILFHRITERNLNYEWLRVFLKEILLFLNEMNVHGLPQRKG